MARAKITIIGAGNVGATAAHLILLKELGDIVLIDVVEGLAQGKALDLMEARPMECLDVEITGSDDYEPSEGSDLVIITAGVARKPGMSREDLIGVNANIVKGCSENVKRYCPDAIVIVVSNPLDAMVYLASRVTGFPKTRVMGQAGVLDTSRFASFIAMELKCSVRQVHAVVLGGHGDAMVPLTRYTNVAGRPAAELMPKERMDEIVERTRKAGGEIVSLLKTGSAYYSPAHATVRMAESIIKDKKEILPCSVFCDKEYGVGGFFMGVIARLGEAGVEEIIELTLDDDEKAMFDKSLEGVKNTVSVLQKMGL